MLTRKKIQADLCVIGGGVAGVLAALSSARMGAKTVLMQERPVLGGNASSEIRMWICGAQGKNMRETGILEEIFLRNYRDNPTKNHYIFDAILLDMVESQENLTLLLNCTCMDAATEEGTYPYGRTKKITSVTGYQMTTQTFYDISAKYFADCSGDSILAPLTGAECMIGRESASEYGEDTRVTEHDSLTMGNSCLLQLRETEAPVPHVRLRNAAKLKKEDFKYCDPDLYDAMENFWYLELGGNRDTIADSETLGRELRSLALGTWSYLKENEEYKAKNFMLDFLGFLPGKRESRRYTGEKVMTERDIMGEERFPDTVAYGGWGIDDHFPDGFYRKGDKNTNRKTPAPYPIPYRILYSKNVDNLYFAGRNISATHKALSSLRVMATCGVMGQAVGTAAALAAHYGCTPHDIYLSHMTELQTDLMDADCLLPYVTRPVSDLCRATPIAGGDALKNGEDRPNRIYGDKECGIVVKNGDVLSYSFDTPADIASVHVVFDSDLDRNTIEGVHSEKLHFTRSNSLLTSPVMYVPKTLCRAYTLTFTYADGSCETHHEDENIVRYLHYLPKKGKGVTSVSLVTERNWGDTDETRVFSFDFR